MKAPGGIVRGAQPIQTREIGIRHEAGRALPEILISKLNALRKRCQVPSYG